MHATRMHLGPVGSNLVKLNWPVARPPDRLLRAGLRWPLAPQTGLGKATTELGATEQLLGIAGYLLVTVFGYGRSCGVRRIGCNRPLADVTFLRRARLIMCSSERSLGDLRARGISDLSRAALSCVSVFSVDREVSAQLRPASTTSLGPSARRVVALRAPGPLSESQSDVFTF